MFLENKYKVLKNYEQALIYRYDNKINEVVGWFFIGSKASLTRNQSL